MYRQTLLILVLTVFIRPGSTFFSPCTTPIAQGCSFPDRQSCEANGCVYLLCITDQTTTSCVYRNPTFCNISPRTICSSTAGLTRTQCEAIHQCKWCPRPGMSSCIDGCDFTTNAIDALPNGTNQSSCTAIGGKYCPQGSPGVPKCQYRHRDCLVSWRENAAPGVTISDIQTCEMTHGGKWCPKPGMPTCIKPQPVLTACFGTNVRIPAYTNKIDCHNNKGIWCDHPTHNFCIQLPDPNCANCSCPQRQACGPSNITYNDCLNEGCQWCNTGIGPKCIFGARTDICLNTRLCYAPHERGITRGYCQAPGNKCKWCPTSGNPEYDGRCVENCPPGHKLRYAHTDQCCRDTTVATSRITGGTQANRGQWPWSGVMFSTLPTGGITQCGAVLISSTLALTAAHCVNGISFINVVHFGTQNTINIDPQAISRVRPSFVLHPNYNPSILANDIAVINLNPSIVFNDVVKPVVLPQSEIVPVGTKCVATGFGLTIDNGVSSTRLLEATMFVQPNEFCVRYGVYNETRHICSGTISGQEGGAICQGDSGGPIVCQRCSSCEWYVAGLSSFTSIICNDPSIVPVFTRVSFYEPWIRSQGYVPPNNITYSCP